MAKAEFGYVDPKEIIINRESRQRREVKPGNLIDSIRRIGIINAITIDRGKNLIAGERRLTAALELGLEKVPFRYFDNLSPSEQHRVELEENLKRQDLPWRDEVKGIVDYHQIMLDENPKWNQGKTAEALGLGPSYITAALRVMQDFDSPKIAKAASIDAAYNVLYRTDARAEGETIAEIEQAGAAFFDEPKEEPEGAPVPLGEPGLVHLAPAHVREEDSTILHADFTQWAPSYSGPKFNFLHCDFPYGVNFNAGPMSGRDKWEQYDDEAEVYWTLIETICKNIDKILAPEAHVMFWLAADIRIQGKTLDTFQKLAPSLAFQTYPLIWFKSDNVGVLPDAKRGPRRVFETAIIGSREDRLIAKPVANLYSCPTDKLHHQSTKPEPMLRHFFNMFCDESTRMLDPTCGSGAAIRAAESLGAKATLGLEISEEHCQNARSALKQFRIKKAMEKLV